ncbi:G-protein coupled receptor 84-like [Narcine bancroftii]|uniref:G-protein coupled receptor 84-like n=1 Tax=Narcine bancroftii TaxID=1343680 RepID=UPI003831762F
MVRMRDITLMQASSQLGPMVTNDSWALLTCDASASEYRHFGAFLGMAVCAVGTLGNGLTILAFVLDPRLRTTFNLLILNLTLADLAYCALLQPVTIHTYMQEAWNWGRAPCQVFGLLLFTLNLVSILSMGLVAGSRYALVTRPEAFRRAFRPLALPLWLGLPWMLSFTCLAPFWDVFEFLPAVCTCSFNRRRGRPYTSILHGLTFGLGLSSIGVFYLLIHRRMRKVSQALSSYGARRNEGEREGSLVQARKSRGRRGKEAEFSRVTAMCFAMFLVYLGCYLPFCLLHLVGKWLSASALAQTLVGNLTWFNSCLNPLLYAAMNRQFRQGYQAVFQRLACWAVGRGAASRTQGSSGGRPSRVSEPGNGLRLGGGSRAGEGGL